MNAPGRDDTRPTRFTRKQRLILCVAPPLAAWAVKALMATCRKEVRHVEHWKRIHSDGVPMILVTWHESAVVGLSYPECTGFCALTSQSFDGELVARTMHRFGLRAPIRGSSSRGGAAALAQLQEALAQAPGVGFAPDGPRGPRRKAKPGVAVLAARTGAPIVPCAYVAGRAWRLHSWDRLIIPHPFSRTISAYGPPIPPPADQSSEAIEATRQQVERELNRLHAETEEALGVRAD